MIATDRDKFRPVRLVQRVCLSRQFYSINPAMEYGLVITKAQMIRINVITVRADPFKDRVIQSSWNATPDKRVFNSKSI